MVLDIGRVEPGAFVHQIKIKSADDVRTALRIAQSHNLKISIRGTNHSQGGHNYLADQAGKPTAIQIITTQWNRVLKIDTKSLQVTVEPGIIWRDLQRELDAKGLAIITQQSSNIFSVGGAISTNVHGRDNQGSIRNSVISLKLITTDGTEHFLSRTQNRKWFDAVIGGYGAFGIITEATLKITRNKAYKANSASDLSVTTYLNEFIRPLRNLEASQQALHWARVTIYQEHRDITFGPITAITWTASETQPDKNWRGWKLRSESRTSNAVAAAMMNAARSSNNGKTLKSRVDEWFGVSATGSIESRNNIMAPPVQFLVDYAEHTLGANDILQEYFVPPEQLATFLGQLQKVARKYQLNLLNITLRYLPAATENSLLTYETSSDLVAVVIYINVEDQRGVREQQIQYSGTNWTRALIDEALALNGNFYLPYQRWWSHDQLVSGYGEVSLSEFQKLKQQIDPNYRFDSNFIRALMAVPSTNQPQ